KTSEVIDRTAPIIKKYMVKNVYEHDIKMMLKVRGEKIPKKKEQISLITLTPAFVLTQIQQGLLIGMFIYLSFVFIDMVVSTVLMYLGMMMLPPMLISLPFKILVFLYIGGYSKIVEVIFRTVNI